MYNIGDKVWYAGIKSERKTMPCPECFGKRYLTVILGDDSEVTIDCAGCSNGWESPTGFVTYYEKNISVSLATIDRIEINPDYVEYLFNRKGCTGFLAKGDRLFDTKEQAEIRAKELMIESNKEELEKINRKERHDRDWSWHVHYYRRQIREAKKTIECAEKKLSVAKKLSEKSKKA